jgi:hypothetical protein
MKNFNGFIVLVVITTLSFSIVFLWRLNIKQVSVQKVGITESISETDNRPLLNQNYSEQKKLDYDKKLATEMELGIRNANVPIEFWGRVIDQDGNPLEDVNIHYRIQQPRVIWDSHSIVKSIITDSAGRFHIAGEKGSSFSFESFRKNGYKKVNGQNVTFGYSNGTGKYTPDKFNPKVYTLIKEDKIQGLVYFSRQLLLNWDDVPVRYNLRTGEFDSSGEIQITARRGKIVGEGRQARYDWSFRIQVVRGGIIETLREEAYIAPEKGYEELWECGYLASDPQWRIARGDVHLIFHLENGNYGRLELNVDAELKRRISGRISSYLNPSGGRLLEYDSRRRVIDRSIPD